MIDPDGVLTHEREQSRGWRDFRPGANPLRDLAGPYGEGWLAAARAAASDPSRFQPGRVVPGIRNSRRFRFRATPLTVNTRRPA